MVTIRQRRRDSIFVLVLGLAGVAVVGCSGGVIEWRGFELLVLALILVFCVFLALVGAAILVAGRKLSLRDDGFTFSYLVFRTTVRWSDVEAFHVAIGPNLKESELGWTYREGCGPKKSYFGRTYADGSGPYNLDLDGRQEPALVGGDWALPLEKLVALMQSRLEASRK